MSIDKYLHFPVHLEAWWKLRLEIILIIGGGYCRKVAIPKPSPSAISILLSVFFAVTILTPLLLSSTALYPPPIASQSRDMLLLLDAPGNGKPNHIASQTLAQPSL